MIDEWINNEPQLIDKDYKKRYDEPCKEIRESGKTWYKGTGINWEKHPLKRFIPKFGCANCNNKDVKIIAAQFSVHPMSGDRYWDCEVFCAKCGKYTQRAYAEND